MKLLLMSLLLPTIAAAGERPDHALVEAVEPYGFNDKDLHLAAGLLMASSFYGLHRLAEKIEPGHPDFKGKTHEQLRVRRAVFAIAPCFAAGAAKETLDAGAGGTFDKADLGATMVGCGVVVAFSFAF